MNQKNHISKICKEWHEDSNFYVLDNYKEYEMKWADRPAPCFQYKPTPCSEIEVIPEKELVRLYRQWAEDDAEARKSFLSAARYLETGEREKKRDWNTDLRDRIKLHLKNGKTWDEIYKNSGNNLSLKSLQDVSDGDAVAQSTARVAYYALGKL